MHNRVWCCVTCNCPEDAVSKYMLLRLFQVLGIGSKLALGSLSVPASGSREKNLHLCGSWGANMKADLVYCPWKEAEMQRIQKCTHSAS